MRKKSVPYSTIAWLSNTKYSCDTVIREEKQGLGFSDFGTGIIMLVRTGAEIATSSWILAEF